MQTDTRTIADARAENRAAAMGSFAQAPHNAPLEHSAGGFTLAPEFSARQTTTPYQVIGIVALVCATAISCLIWGFTGVVHALSEAMMAFYGLVLLHRAGVLIAGALRPSSATGQAQVAALPASPRAQPSVAAASSSPVAASVKVADRLPVVSALIPLYREAGVVSQIVAAIGRMNYPADRLEVVLLLEEDDVETRAACEAHDLPPSFRVVIVPRGAPRTKPRACNYGLQVCRGEIVVVYDAEDQPEPDQILMAARALAAAPPDVACVQARLAYYNPRQNLLTRWFAAEYMGWFELMLPGLHAIHAPIPLGGTSNHFRADALRSCGGWDSWNVAEDCDLGVRLYRCGYQVLLLESTTWEEACPEIRLWIRQRSRWVKGYLQTWLVHTRRPVRLWRDLGTWGVFNMQLLVGGSILCQVVNPIFWFLTLLWWTHPTAWESRVMGGPTLFLGNLCFTGGNALFIAMQAAGAVRRRQWDLAALALLAPIYWLLMSVAAWKALGQIVVAPHHWEKTRHGLAVMPLADALPEPGGPTMVAEPQQRPLLAEPSRCVEGPTIPGDSHTPTP